MISNIYKGVQQFVGGPGGPFAGSRPAAPKAKGKPIALRDRGNVDSELSPADFDDLEHFGYDPREIALLNLGRKRFRSSAIQRYLLEREWIMCTGFDRGNQYVEWRDAANKPEMLLDPNDPNRSYITANLIGNSVIPKLAAYATTTQPDAAVRPLTHRPIDKAAANEARDILHHYAQIYGQDQMLEWVDAALTMSTTFMKLVWDPRKKALVGYFDEQGELQVEDAPVGDLDRIIVPSFEMYPDSKARNWRSVSHLTHAKRMPLSWFQETFGDRGRNVKGEPFGMASSWASWWETRLDSITGEAYRSTTISGHDDSAIYFECWEKPSERFERGRLIRYASDILLTEPDDVDWPYERVETFPFVPLGFRNKYGTLWALNAVHDALPLQRMINEELSRMNDLLETERPTILKPEGSKVKYGDTQDRRNYAEIIYSPGMPPTYQLPPPIGAHRFTFLQTVISILEDITAVHDVSKATIPPNLDSGVAIDLAREGDTTALKGFLTNIERAVQELGEWEIALCAQFYDEPRMMYISQETDPKGAMMDVRAFEALTAGGKCRVEVTPGSATYQSPATRIQRWLDILKSGALTNPQTLPALLAVFEQIGFEVSDTMAQNLREAIMQMIQITHMMQGDPQKMQQQQMAMQAQMAQQQQQLEMMKLQLSARYNAEIEQNRTQADITIQQHKTDADIALAREKAQGDANAAHQEFAANLALQEHEKQTPTTTISVKAGSQGTVGAEKLAGYPNIDEPAEIKEMNAKPPPAAKTPGSSGTP